MFRSSTRDLGSCRWVVPHLLWCFHGTGVSCREVFPLIARPFVAGGVAALCALGFLILIDSRLSALPTLALGCTIFMGVYLYVLLFVLKQSEFFLDIVRTLRGRPEEKAVVAP